MKVILKNALIADNSGKINTQESDITVIDGIIDNIGKAGENGDAKVIDLRGKIVSPGFFDMHVHLREPGREDEETVITGCRAAAAGGFTGIACMPNTEPAIDSAEVVNFIKDKARGELTDVYPVAAATLGRKGEVISPMAELAEAGVKGFSDDGTAIKTASILKRVLEYSLMYDLPVIEHCEDESLAGGAMNEGVNSTMLGLPPIPSIAEDIIVMRDIITAEYTRGKLHLAHISTKKAVEMIRDAKKRGVKVTAEAAPHHFTLSDEALKSYDTNLKMNPPLRSRQDVEAILKGLKDGTIDCIASDHAPHSVEEKEVEFEYAPNGIIGLETEIGLAFSELYHKKILTIEQIIEKFAVNPRNILNIPVPVVKKGEKANMTFLDPDEVWTVDISSQLSKSKNSPFDRRLLTGRALGVINNSRLYFKNEFINI